MSRRIALPGADELFRSTGEQRGEPAERTESQQDGAGDSWGGPDRTPVSRAGGNDVHATGGQESDLPRDPDRAGTSLTVRGGSDGRDASRSEDRDQDLVEASAAVRTAPRRRARAVADRRPTGRERHDEKITVYVSADELMDLEHARLALRGDHGLPVDRGRVVREALAVVLADFEAKGEASILVRRLRGR